LSAGAKKIGCDAGPGTHFKHVRSKIDPFEDPWQNLRLDGALPMARTAEPAVGPIHFD